MVRNYVKKPGSRNYKNYTESQLKKAVYAHKYQGLSLRKAQKEFGVPMRTIKNKCDGKHPNHPGRQPVFTKEKEAEIAQYLVTCAEWGQPITPTEVRMIVKASLANDGRTVQQFSDNTPGEDWVSGFLKRNSEILKLKTAGNIKPPRAAVSVEIVQSYFNQLCSTLEGVSPECIINYDETNLSDDPGRKQYVFRRTCKYPENIINFSKGSTSLMFAGTAAGLILPPYVVYKAEHLWDTWTYGGPSNARYNRSKSGWFDSVCFTDWFKSVIIPYCKRQSGKKVLLGDNLSSHISPEALKLCSELNIHFCFLPKNSTHLTQPLDVVFFAPLKRNWRIILQEYKMHNTSQYKPTIQKSEFPFLLKKLCDQMDLQNNSNVKAGFKACGIYPFQPEQVLKKLPDYTTEESPSTSAVSDAVLQHLHKVRCASTRKKKASAKRRLDVEAGRSISYEEIAEHVRESSSGSSKKIKKTINKPNFETSDDPGVSHSEDRPTKKMKASNKKQGKKQRAKIISDTDTDEEDSCEIMFDDSESNVSETSEVEEHTSSNKLQIPINKRQKQIYLSKVWEALSPPITEKSLQTKWFAGVYQTDHGRKEQMYVGKVVKRFLDDANGRVTHIEMDCLKPPTGIMAETILESVPDHLREVGDHLGMFALENIIAGPVSVTFERGQKWHVPELPMLKKVFAAINKLN